MVHAAGTAEGELADEHQADVVSGLPDGLFSPLNSTISETCNQPQE